MRYGLVHTELNGSEPCVFDIQLGLLWRCPSVSSGPRRETAVAVSMNLGIDYSCCKTIVGM